jgi:hypothetical protein
LGYSSCNSVTVLMTITWCNISSVIDTFLTLKALRDIVSILLIVPIKNEQSRDTGFIGHIRHRSETNNKCYINLVVFHLLKPLLLIWLFHSTTNNNCSNRHYFFSCGISGTSIIPFCWHKHHTCKCPDFTLHLNHFNYGAVLFYKLFFNRQMLY